VIAKTHHTPEFEKATVYNPDQHVFHDQKLVHALKAGQEKLGTSEGLLSSL
jgi:hypothetical protein